MNVVQPLKDKRDIERMKQALADSPRNLLLFTIGINTALRISDILPLKARDVSNDYIVIREKKTGKRNRIKINDSIREVLPSNLAPDEYLFQSRQGDKPIGRIQAWHLLNRAAEVAGLDIDIGTHSLRKTFSFHAYESGVDISLLMRILNHASQRETLRYIGIEQDDVDDVYIDVCL